FLLQSMPLLLVALFCTGLQSTLFGPVKYSVLPAILKPEELTGGNGLVEMGTSISILGGMITGGLIFQVAGAHGPEAAAAAIVALAIAGNLVARMIPRVDAGAPDLKIGWNPLPESLAVLRMARAQPAVRNAISAGALFSFGTGTGWLRREKLSARTVEIGRVPLGAAGMSAFLLDLYFARPGAPPATGLDVAGFLAQPGSLRIVVDLLGIGVFTGFFVVPLFALIQSRTPSSRMSRVFAALNIQNSGFIVLAAVVGLGAGMLGWSSPQLFLALAIANVLVAAWIFALVPEFLMRFLSWVLVRALYRLRVRGVEEHVPDEGAAVIVCNHVSYMDALILAASIPRPVRFVMYYRIFDIPVMSWIFRAARAIPIAGAREDPERMQRAFDAIDAALAEGELVCIFPEGALTKDGEIAPFRSGVERILERAAAAGRPVPVVPMALRGMWASMWSRRDSRLGRMRVPRRLRARVEVVAEAPLHGLVTAGALETRVRGLRGDAA